MRLLTLLAIVGTALALGGCDPAPQSVPDKPTDAMAGNGSNAGTPSANAAKPQTAPPSTG